MNLRCVVQTGDRGDPSFRLSEPRRPRARGAEERERLRLEGTPQSLRRRGAGDDP